MGQKIFFFFFSMDFHDSHIRPQKKTPPSHRGEQLRSLRSYNCVKLLVHQVLKTKCKVLNLNITSEYSYKLNQNQNPIVP